MNRRVVALAVLATAVLTACGASAPPPAELANEMVDTLDVSAAVKDCMHERLEAYTDSELEAMLDGLESENTETQTESEDALADFERDLRSCT